MVTTEFPEGTLEVKYQRSESNQDREGGDPPGQGKSTEIAEIWPPASPTHTGGAGEAH